MRIVFVFQISDRFRTTINVMCDALGTILVNHLSKKDLASADRVSFLIHGLKLRGPNKVISINIFPIWNSKLIPVSIFYLMLFLYNDLAFCSRNMGIRTSFEQNFLSACTIYWNCYKRYTVTDKIM